MAKKIKKQHIPNTQEALSDVKSKLNEALELVTTEQMPCWDRVATIVSLAHSSGMTVNYYAKNDLPDVMLKAMEEAKVDAAHYNFAWHYKNRDVSEDATADAAHLRWLEMGSKIDYSARREALLQKLHTIVGNL